MDRARRVFVKKAGAEDVQSSVDFACRMIKEVYGRGVNTVWDQDLLNFEKTYLLNTDNAFFTAVDDKETIVGCLAVRRYNGRIKILEGLYELKLTAELAKCFVAKEYRRAGVGSLLVAKAERFCRKAGYRIIYLHTHKYLPGALAFWQSREFTVSLEEGGPGQTVHMEKII